MKQKRIVAPLLAITLLSITASVTGTVAWFSANKTVTSTGMKVKAKATGSLVISASAPTAGSTATSYNFNDEEATNLYASTHDWDNTASTGLVYVTNAENIALETGLPYTSNDVINYANAAPMDEETIFYKDYSIFISSCGAPLENQQIKVELINDRDLSINGAMSIDFYISNDNTSSVVTPSSTTYVDTLNLAQYDAKANNCTEKSSFYFVTSDKTIAHNNDGKGISVLMRVYYDGALKDNSKSNAYLLTNKGSGIASAPTEVFNNRGGKLTVQTGTDLSNYYLSENVTRNSAGSITTYNCDSTFARTVDSMNLEEISLGVRFTAEEYVEEEKSPSLFSESLPGDNEVDADSI